MDKPIKIKITIADRQYPLTIQPQEEEVLRKAGKVINEQIASYEKAYAVNDKQDALAMCALQFAAKYHGNTQTQKDNDEEIIQKIKSLRLLLERTNT